MKKGVVLALALGVLLIPVALLYASRFSKAAPTKANITVDTRRIISPLFQPWKALSQGGEERGTRMIQPVISQIKELAPRYIRIDHIYDNYDVVSRDSFGNLTFDFSKLDDTVCDILQTGAKPFLSLGYMPPTMSTDGTVIGAPKNWDEWTLLVQKTIERYSGRGTVMCGGAIGHALINTYYEVWNEPDLEQFGKWSIQGGKKDYKTLYYYSAQGAARAQSVNDFSLGGPAITAAYKNWFQTFLTYIAAQNLRIDFLSWHHYTNNPDNYLDDLASLNSWIPTELYGRFSALPKIISEWGYDSNPNQKADTDLGAAYTVAAVRNMVSDQLSLAISFEVKDGPTRPSWGILSYQGEKKPRYNALKLLNLLDGNRLMVTGEGTFVKALASTTAQKTTVVLVNYDQDMNNVEDVPVTFTNLAPGTYQIHQTYASGQSSLIDNLLVTETSLSRTFLMPPNSVLALELLKK